MSPEAVRTAMGIAPTAVPTYLALTSSPKAEALTNRQAVRLIERKRLTNTPVRIAGCVL